MDPVDHMQAVRQQVRECAERIGEMEAEHGIVSEQARQAREDWRSLLDRLSTEAQELAEVIDELNHEYFG